MKIPWGDLSKSAASKSPKPRAPQGLVFLLLALAWASRLHAMIFYSTANPDFNTTAPTGALTDSGWQWVGTWGAFQGVPIGPHHFLAAHHIGGSIGDAFVLNGVTYTTTAFTDDPASDLRLWQVDGTFPSWTPLYRASAEIGQSLIVFGRGLTRGAAVTANNVLRGWMWGASDGRLRWGQNTFASVVDGGSYWGALLYATFDQNGGSNEAHLAVGDSSSPIFINDGSGWKLAGVAAAVDAYFNTVNSGNGFNAAIFDSRGLYYSPTPPTGWNLVTGTAPVPSGFYATRVSARAGWIDTIVSPSETSEDAPLLTPALLGLLAGLLVSGGIWFLRRQAAAI